MLPPRRFSDFGHLNRQNSDEISPGSQRERSPGAPLPSPSSGDTGRNLSIPGADIPIPLHQLYHPRRRSTRSSGFQPGLTPAQVASASSENEVSLVEEDEYLSPIATSKCLQFFADVEARKKNKRNIEVRQEKDDYVKQCQAERAKHERTLSELRAWADSQKSTATIKGWFKTTVKGLNVRHPPSADRLEQMALYYYPLRSNVKAYICDFGHNKFKIKEVSLADIEPEFADKPDWADVRWIHAPLNVGLVQSSLEDIFLKGNREVDTAHAQNISWPYAQIETISFRKRDDLKNMQDVHQILANPEFAKDKTIAQVTQSLDSIAFKGLSDSLRQDIEWRAEHWGLDHTYWNLVLPDLHRQMSSSSAEFIDPDYTNHAKTKVEKQAISRCRLYERAHLIRCNFRCFHRSDGYLLTMCANGGIDFIDRLLDERIDKPGDSAFQDEDGSLVALLFELFSKTGSSSWHSKNADWLLVYMLTEIAAKPTNFRQGCNAPSLSKAYQTVVQQLKAQRYEEFVRKESVNLVRDFLSCIDELTTQSIIWTRNRGMLDHLKGQVIQMEAQMASHNESVHFPGDETAMDRVLWADKIAEDNENSTRELLSDLRQSLNALFQLRSIEQNELAISADNQNKAILLFTGVTIIFLPLSFFTSYFGMNLKGISDTTLNESYFWKVCGTIAFVMILATILYVGRHRMSRQIRRHTSIPV